MTPQTITVAELFAECGFAVPDDAEGLYYNYGSGKWATRWKAKHSDGSELGYFVFSTYEEAGELAEGFGLTAKDLVNQAPFQWVFDGGDLANYDSLMEFDLSLLPAASCLDALPEVLRVKWEEMSK
jgi:hypothetical protein